MKPLKNLGQWLGTWINEYESKEFVSDDSKEFAEIVVQQHLLNSWHTEQDIIAMINHLSNILSNANLAKWISLYPELLKSTDYHSPVLIKPNMNYSFAGIQEWLCCLITKTPFVLNANENQFQILKFFCRKLAKEDKELWSLFDINPRKSIKCDRYIIYPEKKHDSLNEYFKLRKVIIIEPTNTVGVITGQETAEEFSKLGRDIFLHLGQSPRSLRKLFIPVGFDIKEIIAAIESYSGVYQNNKYANNYDYHQSVFLMNSIPFLDNGFLIFKEDKLDEAPTGCLFYEYYNDISDILKKLKAGTNIENIVCADELPVKTVKPGESHFFDLWDYLNNKDVVNFLLSN